MTSLTTTQHGEHLEQPISTDVSPTRGLLDRERLLQLLNRAVLTEVPGIGPWTAHGFLFASAYEGLT